MFAETIDIDRGIISGRWAINAPACKLCQVFENLKTFTAPHCANRMENVCPISYIIGIRYVHNRIDQHISFILPSVMMFFSAYEPCGYMGLY